MVLVIGNFQRIVKVVEKVVENETVVLLKEVVQPYNSGIWEAEEGRLWVQDQPGIPSKTLYQKRG